MAADVAKTLADIEVDLASIADPNMRRCVVGQLNIIQQLIGENTRLRQEVQRQRDEIARLKGEQGRPDIKANTGDGGADTDHSSEAQRKKGRKKRKKRKKKPIEVDRTQRCPVDPRTLPEDAEYKGTETKAELLLVLSHPELPLHNNDSELGARARVRKRDVSFGPRTPIGAQAWNTMQSLVGTVKKLGVNIYEYFEDRVTGRGAVPRLADVIEEQAAELNLAGSWKPAPVRV